MVWPVLQGPSRTAHCQTHTLYPCDQGDCGREYHYRAHHNGQGCNQIGQDWGCCDRVPLSGGQHIGLWHYYDGYRSQRSSILTKLAYCSLICDSFKIKWGVLVCNERVWFVSVRSMDGCCNWIDVLEGRTDLFCGNLAFFGFWQTKMVAHNGCLLTVTVYFLDQKLR